MRRSRLLIQDVELRKLFWIGEEKDGSLYIGSYLSANKYGMGSFVKPPKGNVHVSYSDGKIFDLNRNAKIKISFHPSGQAHVKTQDKLRECLLVVKREELYKIKGCRNLGFFLPKEAVNYPIIEKTRKKDTDVVLSTAIFDQKPFVINLYLAEKSFDPEQLASPKKGKMVFVVWANMLQLILIAYQTEETRKEGVFPPKEYWIIPDRTSL
jgi:hypothetical protein